MKNVTSEPVTTSSLRRRMLFLSIADYVAGWVAGDKLAPQLERETAQAHRQHLRQWLRQVCGLLKARGQPAVCRTLGRWIPCDACRPLPGDLRHNVPAAQGGGNERGSLQHRPE